MKELTSYPVNFGYGAKTTINGVPYTHRGLDYPLVYEPVVVQGVQIGVSGATGKVTGPHVHVQAGKDEWAQQTINPSSYVGKPGTVVKRGTASEWGNYVTIKVGSVYVYYCHLSKINVSIGAIIKKETEEMVSPKGLDYIYRYTYGKAATAWAKRYLLGKMTFDKAEAKTRNAKVVQKHLAQLKANVKLIEKQLPPSKENKAALDMIKNHIPLESR